MLNLRLCYIFGWVDEWDKWKEAMDFFLIKSLLVSSLIKKCSDFEEKIVH